MFYVNPHTVRIVGEVIPEGPGREGAPVTSVLDEAKKSKTKRRGGTDWSREAQRTGISQQEAQSRLDEVSAVLQELEHGQSAKRSAWLDADDERFHAAQDERRISRSRSKIIKAGKTSNTPKPPRTPEEQHAYNELQQTRRHAEDTFTAWAREDTDLRQLRSTKYALEKIIKTKPSPDHQEQTAVESWPTWSRPCGENRTENLHIDHLLSSTRHNPRRGVGFLSDDPGIATMQETVTMTLSEVASYIRHYNISTSNRFELLEDIDALEPPKSTVELKAATVELPPILRVTAPLLSDLSFSKRNGRQRERRLAEDNTIANNTRESHSKMSSNSIHQAISSDDIDTAQQIRREARDHCREFENSDRRQKEMRTQELRTKRAYATVAAEQRSK
ncbi:hypothetical protein BGX33_002852, partial [Mortierella sp. NVP41]